MLLSLLLVIWLDLAFDWALGQFELSLWLNFRALFLFIYFVSFTVRYTRYLSPYPIALLSITLLQPKSFQWYWYPNGKEGKNYWEWQQTQCCNINRRSPSKSIAFRASSRFSASPSEIAAQYFLNSKAILVLSHT